MLGTTELIIIASIAFLLFGGAIFSRASRQVVKAKREASKAVKEIMDDEEKSSNT